MKRFSGVGLMITDKGKQRKLTETHVTVMISFHFVFPLYPVVKELSSYNKQFQGLLCDYYYPFIHNNPGVENEQLQSAKLM